MENSTSSSLPIIVACVGRMESIILAFMQYKKEVLAEVGWSKRFICYCLDVLIISLGITLVDNLWQGAISKSPSCVLPVHFYGATLGQHLFKLRTNSQDSKKTPSIGKLLLREFLYLTMYSIVGFFIFLWWGCYWDEWTKINVVYTKSS